MTPSRWAVAGVVAVYLALALPLLPRHGVTYDAPALFYGGDRTLFFLTHPSSPGALAFQKRGDPPGFHPFFSRDDEWEDPMRYPVLPALVAAGVSAVTHDLLGMLDPITAHHLGLVLLQALGLALFVGYGIRLVGLRAAVLGGLALAFFPTAFGHAFNNPKDWPCAMAYGLVLLATGVAVLEDRPRQLLVAGLFLGLALSAKMNAVFAGVTAALWIPLASRMLRRPLTTRPRLLAATLAAPYLAGAVFLLAWPWLWAGGFLAGEERLHFYLHFIFGYGIGGRPGWTAYPFQCLLWMTPAIVLLTAAAGTVALWRTREVAQRAVLLLFLLWMGLPLLRTALPRSNFYDANRHFLEYVPGLCALAGVGADALFGALGRRLAGRWQRPAGWAAAGVFLLALLWPVARYAPFETTYFNVFAGGLGGAQRSALFRFRGASDPRVEGTEGDYWYQSLRHGLRTLSERIEGPTVVGVCGLPPLLAEMNTLDRRLRPVRILGPGAAAAPYVWLSPREHACGWATVRALETERPTLARVERGGGLIYELLGPPSPQPLVPRSAENGYLR